MKTNVLPNNVNTRKNFFLLMIAPLLIGLMISLMNSAHAEWNTKNDPLLHKSPKEQGWKQIQIYQSSATPQKVNKKS